MNILFSSKTKLNIGNGLLLGIIFSLFLVGFSFVQNAEALTATISDETSCLALSNNPDRVRWVGNDTCVFMPDYNFINGYKPLVVDSDIVLRIESRFENRGDIVNDGTILVRFNSSFDNQDSIHVNPSFSHYSTVINNGLIEIENHARFDNEALIMNSGVIDNHTVVSHYGPPTGFTNYGTITNTNTMNNYGTIHNNGIINNGLVDVAGNSGTITNAGIINNNDVIDNNCNSQIVQSTGTISGNTVNEILCIPNLISPSDGSFVSEPKPVLTWENDLENRLITYTVNLESFSNGLISTTSLTPTSSEPLNNLLNEAHTWNVKVNLDSNYSPNYLFTHVPVMSEPDSFKIIPSKSSNNDEEYADKNTKETLPKSLKEKLAKEKLPLMERKQEFVKQQSVLTNSVLPPLKQISEGMSAADVTCNSGLEKIFKNNNSPICVKSATSEKLIQRNLAHR